MSATILELLEGSARLCNVIQQGEPLTAVQQQVFLTALSGMIDSYSNNPLLSWNVNEYSFPITGAASYTLGLGGDWNIPRPMNIAKAVARTNGGTPQQVDIPMTPITFMQYADLTVKNTTSQWGFCYYDDRSYPLRTIRTWPIGIGPAEMVMWLRDPLLDLSVNSIYETGSLVGGTGYTDGFYEDVRLAGGSGTGAQANVTVLAGVVTNLSLTAGGTGYTQGDVLTPVLSTTGTSASITVAFVSIGLNDTIIFPPGYERFFRFNLAVEVAPEFGKDLKPSVVETAAVAKDELERQNNVDYQRVGDGGLNGLNNRGVFSIYSPFFPYPGQTGYR